MYVMCNLKRVGLQAFLMPCMHTAELKKNGEKETTHDKIRLDLVGAPELHVHAYSLYII